MVLKVSDDLNVYLQIKLKHLQEQLKELQENKDALTVSRTRENALQRQVSADPGFTHVVGTCICLHSHITGTSRPYGDKNQVPETV